MTQKLSPAFARVSIFETPGLAGLPNFGYDCDLHRYRAYSDEDVVVVRKRDDLTPPFPVGRELLCQMPMTRGRVPLGRVIHVNKNFSLVLRSGGSLTEEVFMEDLRKKRMKTIVKCRRSAYNTALNAESAILMLEARLRSFRRVVGVWLQPGHLAVPFYVYVLSADCDDHKVVITDGRSSYRTFIRKGSLAPLRPILAGLLTGTKSELPCVISEPELPGTLETAIEFMLSYDGFQIGKSLSRRKLVNHILMKANLAKHTGPKPELLTSRRRLVEALDRTYFNDLLRKSGFRVTDSTKDTITFGRCFTPKELRAEAKVRFNEAITAILRVGGVSESIIHGDNVQQRRRLSFVVSKPELKGLCVLEFYVTWTRQIHMIYSFYHNGECEHNTSRDVAGTGNKLHHILSRIEALLDTWQPALQFSIPRS